jgi:hypothetical protein
MDLIREVDWECARTSKLVTGIVSRLAAYTEEGVAMTPSVFICNSISELLQRAGMGEYVPLSIDIPLDDTAAPKLLKAAAPLCRDNWRIYVERSNTGQTCRFGVFCGSSDPSSLTVDEVVFDDLAAGFPIVKIAQSAINKVEVRTSVGNRIEFRFNDDVDVHELNNQAHIQNLARAISAGVGPQAEVFSGFVERLLSSAIENSHGTLIAVLPAGTDVLPGSLQDVVPLLSPVSLYERFTRHLDEGKTAASVGRLQTAVELVSGFICSDGITIFNGSGNVLGYRAFIRNNMADTPSAGGARSRAYAAMCRFVGVDLDAAFFRSQDGRTEFHQQTVDGANE